MAKNVSIPQAAKCFNNPRPKYILGGNVSIPTDKNMSQGTKSFNFPILYTTIKSVFHKDKSTYYYNIFLEKASHELSKK